MPKQKQGERLHSRDWSRRLVECVTPSGTLADTVPAKVQRKLSVELMQAVDEATKKALADLGLEAFRFDVDICSKEQWLRLKIKIRPVGR